MKVDLAERHAISGEIPAALHTLREARELDPSNKVIRDRLTELSALDPRQARQILSGPEPPREVHLEHLPGKQNFRLRGDTQSAYEEIAQKFGVDVAFDVDLRSRQVHVDANDLDFATATRILGEQTHTFWRPLTKHLFFVADDTTQKRKIRSLDRAHGLVFVYRDSGTDDGDLASGAEVAGITRSQLDTRSRTLTMRASPQAIAVASGVIGRPRPAGRRTGVGNRKSSKWTAIMRSNLASCRRRVAMFYTIPSNAVTEAESGLPDCSPSLRKYSEAPRPQVFRRRSSPPC